MSVRPLLDDDCEEHGGNGGGCYPLRILGQEVQRVAQKQAEQDTITGQFVRAVSEASGASNRAAMSAERAAIASIKAQESAERIERRLFEDVNAVIAKHSSPPPPDWDDAGEITKTQDVRTIYKRAKRAERQRLYAVIGGGVVTLGGTVWAILKAIAVAKGWMQ